MSLFEDALVAGKLHVDGRPVVDWETDRETGRVELILASEWEEPAAAFIVTQIRREAAASVALDRDVRMETCSAETIREDPMPEPFEKKPLPDDGGMGSPERLAWLATLDHTTCRQINGQCYDIHCAYCGNAMGGGWGPCSKGCSPR